MKPLTMPKLQQQESLFSTRLRDEIQLAPIIPVERTFIWTESTTFLQWLQTTEKLTVFVAKRGAEFLALSKIDEWNHVRTFENPADAGARGFSAHGLSESHWLKGPDFFKTEDWHSQPSTDVLENLKRDKFKSSQVPPEHKKQAATAITTNVANNASIFEWQKYSSYEKLLRIIAYLLRLLPKFA